MSLMPDELGRKPRVGVFSLTGCAGDQLVILNNEDVLLELAGRVDIVSFAMAHSVEKPGELDLALVEGSVCSHTDREVLLSVRERSRYLMAIGTCAVWGGIPAMVSHIPLSELKKTVYGDAGALPEAQEANPLSTFVEVDYALTGCPIESSEFTAALASLLAGSEPRRIDDSVCSQCRIRENVCLVQSKCIVCCGPITAAGCGARCVGYGQPCYGCRGPVDDPHYDATSRMFKGHGLSKEQVIEAIRRYSAPAWVERRLAPGFAADPQRRGLRRVVAKEKSHG